MRRFLLALSALPSFACGPGSGSTTGSDGGAETTSTETAGGGTGTTAEGSASTGSGSDAGGSADSGSTTTGSGEGSSGLSTGDATSWTSATASTSTSASTDTGTGDGSSGTGTGDCVDYECVTGPLPFSPDTVLCILHLECPPVELTVMVTQDGVELFEVPSCGPGYDGWVWRDPPPSPDPWRAIGLCGTACDALKAGADFDVIQFCAP